MWGRVIEISTATWLAIAPFVFNAQDDSVIMWGDNMIALAIIVLAGLSYWHPTRMAHLLTLVIAVGLFLWGRFSGPTPLPPIHQNHIVIGLFLMMIAIIPNHASRPPIQWREPAANA